MSGKIFYVLALLLAVSQPAAAQQPMPAMPVSVAQVIERDVQQWHEYSGRLSAVDRVEIRSRVTGPIETVNFKDNSIVKKGDLLFTIDPRPYAAEVARTQAALLQAKATRDLDMTRFKRAQSLIKDKAIAQSDYDLRKNELAVANAQVESAQAQLDAAKLNLDYAHITSPIAGRVGRAELTVGNLVQTAPNSPLLTTVVSQNPIYADFDIDEATYLKLGSDTTGDASKIAVKMELAGGGAERQGSMQSFDNRLNPQSGTLRARAVFNNDDGVLVPGLFARIRLGSAELTKAVLITDRAVGTDQSKKYVYVVGPDNKVEYREVKLGDMSGNLRIITDGLKAGEKIIVDGLARAHPGAEVKPELVDMEASPGAPSGDSAASAGDKDKKGAEKPAAAAPAEDKKEGDKQGDTQGDVQGDSQGDAKKQ